MEPTLSYKDLKALNPCADSLKRIAKLFGGTKWSGVTAAQARAAGATFEDIVWTALALARARPDIERRLRLWVADCATHVLHNYEREYPSDTRPRDAITASRQFARGEISSAAWSAARSAAFAALSAASAARSAAWGAASAAWSAASAASAESAESAESAARSAARSAESAESAASAAWSAARSAASAAWSAASAAWSAAWSAESVARSAEQAWQFDRLCERLSASEPADYPLPELEVKP